MAHRVPQAQASGLPFSTKSSPWGRDGKPGEASPIYPTLFASLFIWHKTRYVYGISCECAWHWQKGGRREGELTPRTAESPILDAFTSR